MIFFVQKIDNFIFVEVVQCFVDKVGVQLCIIDDGCFGFELGLWMQIFVVNEVVVEFFQFQMLIDEGCIVWEFVVG